MNLPNVLGLDDKTYEVAFIGDHCTGNGPVCPRSVWRLHDVHTIGLDVSSTIMLVNLGRRDLGQINLVSLKEVLLARACFQDLRGDRGHGASGEHFVEDLAHRGSGWQSEMTSKSTIAVLGGLPQ